MSEFMSELKIGDRIRLKMPRRATRWEMFLWCLFRIERPRETEVAEWVVIGEANAD